VAHDDNASSVRCDSSDNQHTSPVQQDRCSGSWPTSDGLSPQPMITLTDMTDSAALSGDRREQILYSEDFDAIQDYLQNTDSPMLTLSPSWLCRGTEHVFPPTPLSHSVKHNLPLTNSTVTRVTPHISVTLAQPTMTTHSSTIDVSSSIGSSSLHGREVCLHVVFFLV